ncbi:hypothetical protein JJO83_13125 [Halomonas aquamarina]|uniref:hypothetical protein n=1 Tax=Vreelandella aquamarina TaxID=77097 RepID=UPI00235A0046|nr:hypothetical protein [Halomonas aquamarina]MDC8443631.1 hypothetical protein [Halomonas aquamarina]
MTADEHQQVIDELQAVINDTQNTIDRFEATGMDEQMPESYEKLLDILDDAVKQQREHVLGMLGWRRERLSSGRFLYAGGPPLQEALEGRFFVKKLRKYFYVKKRQVFLRSVKYAHFDMQPRCDHHVHQRVETK